MRILIGASEVERVPAKVLAFSIREHASKPVEIVMGYEHPVTKSLRRGATNFSFHRFAVPEIFGSGQALYMDSDMVVMADICELGGHPFEPGQNVAKCHGWQTAIVIFQCERCAWSASRIEGLVRHSRPGYVRMMNFSDEGYFRVKSSIPDEWNCLDRLTPNTKNLHYTDMRTQPWLYPGHSLEWVWMHACNRAIKAGELSQSELMTAADARHVRSDLLPTLEMHAND